jgi:DNA-binding NtrC family response regulator
VSDATTIDASASSPPTGGEPGERAYLLVRRGERTEVIDVEDGDELLLGRGADATIQIDDAKASREHARIGRRGDALYIQDLGSRNGTRLNDSLLRGERRPLVSGDLVRIGDTEVVVARTPTVHARARLDRELARVAAAGGGRAALVRVGLVDADPRAVERLAPVLAGATVVEAQEDGEYICLLADDEAVVTQLVARLGELAPEAEVGRARFPDDGRTAAELVARARGEGTPAPAVVSAPVLPGVVVADAAMVKVFELVRKVAPTPTTVLILGETGVGKEVVAEQLHLQSPRAPKPFLRLNCGSLPETLLESELFGHERGAFTGADRRKVGYLEAADGGTLFLDEVGELPLPMQAKLLRVIESRRFMRVGGREEIAVDVRIVSATNRDLEAEARAGRFREDLYFRLSAFVVRIPPLRERPAEVVALAELFARQFAARQGREAPGFAGDATAALRRHGWPGNVRELRNAIEHAVVMSEGAPIRAEHLPEGVRRPTAAGGAGAGAGAGAGTMRDHLAAIEVRTIEEALAAEGGNQTRAAMRLGITRRALIYRMSKYGVGKDKR